MGDLDDAGAGLASWPTRGVIAHGPCQIACEKVAVLASSYSAKCIRVLTSRPGRPLLYIAVSQGVSSGSSRELLRLLGLM